MHHDSVLNLGEKIVLAARLASIEHVRQEIAAEALRAEVAKREAGSVGDRANRFTDEPDSVALSQPVPVLLGEVFRRIESQTRMPRVRGAA